MAAKGTLRTCENGHRYYKSGDCPTCPTCEIERKPAEGFLSVVAAPARRALARQGITTLQKLAQKSRAEVLALHGIGPKALPVLEKALRDAGLKFS